MKKILPLCQKQRVIWAGPYVTSKEFLSRWSIFGEHEAVETIEDILQKKQIKAECMPGCRMLSDEECKIWQVEPERFDEPGNERWLETITGRILLYVCWGNMSLSREKRPAERF